jgi:hypothetical protein
MDRQVCPMPQALRAQHRDGSSIQEERGSLFFSSSSNESWQNGQGGNSEGKLKKSNIPSERVYNTCSEVHVPAVAFRARSN